MNILMVLENYFPHIGGVEAVFQNLAEGLVKRGHDVYIVTRQLSGTSLFEIRNGVEIHRVPTKSRYTFVISSISKVFELARDADLIHTTTFTGAPPAWLASKIIGVPSIITVHEVWLGNWNRFTDFGLGKSIVHEMLEEAIYGLNFDRYVCVSDSTNRQLKEMGRKAITIYNGVDYNHFNPNKYNYVRKLEYKNKFVCLTYGRPGPSKGIEYVVKAMPTILKQIPSAHLVLILSRNKAYLKRREEIIRLIKELDLENNVDVLDPVSFDILPAYIKNVDCVIVPSLAEGFGYTTAESCAMGTPVVASNTTSIPEVISGNYVLVKPKSPQDISRGVLQIYKKKGKKTKLKRFLWQDAIDKYLQVYKEVLNG